MEKLYYDENHNYSFNFTKAINIFEPHVLSQKTTILSDVDFIIETEHNFIFLEFKNATHHKVTKPEEFIKKITDSKLRQIFCESISKKFYSSLFLLWLCKLNESEKEIDYVLLAEHPIIDGKFRKTLREQIYKQLPFKLCGEPLVKRKVIKNFNVMNMEEWHNTYVSFKIDILN